MKMPGLRWDLFCKVIDNHGDLGVSWRLSHRLAEMGHTVRLFIDEPSALIWMAPQGHPKVTCMTWPNEDFDNEPQSPPDVLIEAFGCEIPDIYLNRLKDVLLQSTPPKPWVWLNLEYLSAEAYVERMHQMPSPVTSGPLRGQIKWFYYPGFTDKTGGLLYKAFSKTTLPNEHHSQQPYWVLFCYEPNALPDLLTHLQSRAKGVTLRVTAGRAQQAIRSALKRQGLDMPKDAQQIMLGQSQIEFLPYLSQEDFDEQLAHSDLNFVRGEDSWVRAIWAKKPFIWQIYPQSDRAHETKLMAFLTRFDAPSSLVNAHLHWNDLNSEPLQNFSKEVLLQWRQWCESVSQILSANPELGLTLEHFVNLKLSQFEP